MKRNIPSKDNPEGLEMIGLIVFSQSAIEISASIFFYLPDSTGAPDLIAIKDTERRKLRATYIVTSKRSRQDQRDLGSALKAYPVWIMF